MIQAVQQMSPLTKSESGPQNTALSVSEKLEAVFLAEMLKSAGVGKSPEDFGGGVGEDQFASFLREAQAREMVRAGGLGLAAHFERAIRADSL